MPVKFWQTIVRYWFFLSYLINWYCIFLHVGNANPNWHKYNFHRLYEKTDNFSNHIYTKCWIEVSSNRTFPSKVPITFWTLHCWLLMVFHISLATFLNKFHKCFFQEIVEFSIIQDLIIKMQYNRFIGYFVKII